MAGGVRYRPFAEQIRLAKVESERYFQQIHANTARAEHARVMGTAPRPQSFYRFVDGVEGASEDSVRLAGVIHYEYPRLDLIATEALALLREISPLGWPEGGHYRDEHIIFVNDVAVPNVSAWRPGDDLAIVNVMPYARMIEVGAMKMVVPGTDHVYAQAVQQLRRVWSSIASIRFQWRSGQPALSIMERRG